MIILDTSALLRFFSGDDEGKSKKVGALLESKEDLLLIEAVVVELVFTSLKVYRQSKFQVLDALNFLLARTNIRTSANIRMAIKIYEKINISITDALVVVYGDDNKIASFDERLLSVQGVKSVWK